MIVTRNVRVRSRAAFTLMEVMVAAAILVVLASVAGVAVFSYLETAKVDAARAGTKIIERAVVTYNLSSGSYPDTLEALLQPVAGKPALLEEKDLFDPWRQPFIYEPGTLSPTGKPLIYSQGANPGDASNRITNWD